MAPPSSYDELVKSLRSVMAGAEGRVGSPRSPRGVPSPAIPLNVARPYPDDRDHRDSPLRGGPVMTTERAASTVIYGEASNGKDEPSTSCSKMPSVGHVLARITDGSEVNQSIGAGLSCGADVTNGANVAYKGWRHLCGKVDIHDSPRSVGGPRTVNSGP
jgi:hypothetical protein